jgi:SAM-dependent methyltransferase
MTDQSLTDFYDSRYADGYMEAWPERVRARIALCIASLDLPARGWALDFGCGSGALTGVIKSVLPGWTVCGTDLSAVALEQARQQHPDCTFFPLDRPPDAHFDFIFSHHVLEHVADLDATWAQIVALAAPQATMLHILPCGNPGSFEHRLASLRVDGIDPAQGDRFFYEDEGHVRRLTSATVTARARAAGFAPVFAYFANQDAGALDWITDLGAGFVARLCDPSAARDAAARAELSAMEARLRRTLARKQWLVPLQAQIERVHHAARPTIRQRVGLLLEPLLFNRLTLPLITYARAAPRRAAEREWQTRRTEPNGSAMYLAFRR